MAGGAEATAAAIDAEGAGDTIGERPSARITSSTIVRRACSSMGRAELMVIKMKKTN